MPLTFGGRIRTFEDAANLIANGADKIVVNTAAYEQPELITRIAQHFGSQCVVVGLDVKREQNQHRLYVQQGRCVVDEAPVDWAKRAVDFGAGEIFLNSIDRDGAASGYDLEIIDQISKVVKIPVIACGGAGCFEDFEDVLNKTSASAAAAGNIFNFTENAYLRAKKHLIEAGCLLKPACPKSLFYEKGAHA